MGVRRTDQLLRVLVGIAVAASVLPPAAAHAGAIKGAGPPIELPEPAQTPGPAQTPETPGNPEPQPTPGQGRPESSRIHTVFLFEDPVNLDALAAGMRASEARFVSARHAAPLVGGFDAGDASLEESLDLYRSDYQAMVDTEEDPPVVALRLEGAVPTHSLDDLAESVASRTLVHDDTVLAITNSSEHGRQLRVVKGGGRIASEEPTPTPTPSASEETNPSPVSSPEPQESESPTESANPEDVESPSSESPVPSPITTFEEDSSSEVEEAPEPSPSGGQEPTPQASAGESAAVSPSPESSPTLSDATTGDDGDASEGRRKLRTRKAPGTWSAQTGGGGAPAWVPDRGRVGADVLPNGRRKVFHMFRWTSASDLAAFAPDANSARGYPYEHDFKLFGCTQQTWATHNGVTFGTTLPEASGPYLNDAWPSAAGCELDLTAGAYLPTQLQAATDYSTVIYTAAGPTASSEFQLRAEKLENNCSETGANNDPSCVGLDEPATQRHTLIGRAPGCIVPGSQEWNVSSSQPCLAAVAPSAYRDVTLADNPLAYFRLNESSGNVAVNEIARSYPGPAGTYTGTHSLGQAGATQDGDKSVDLQGGHVAAPQPSALGLGSSWSLEGWVRPTETTPGGSIVTEAYGGDDNVRFSLGYEEGSGGRFFVGFYNGSWHRAVDPTATELNRWTHYVGTYDGTTLRLYRDGQLVASGPSNGTWRAGNESIYIGRRWDHAQTIKGRVDEVAIYNGVLSSTRVSDHFNCAGTSCNYRAAVMADQPAAFFRLGEGSGSQATNEVSRSSDGTYSGTHTLAQSGATQDGNKSVDLQGGHVAAGRASDYSFTSSWTVEGWVNPTELTTAGTIISEGYEGDNNVRFVLGYYDASGGRFFAGFYDGTWHRAEDPQPIALNRWSHYAGTYDGSTLKLYRDGQLVASTTPNRSVPNGNESIYIGKRWDSNETIKGRVDEVAFYGSALSAARVSAHYDAGAPKVNYQATTLADEPAGYWRLGEAASSPEARDETANGHGTYTGSVTRGEPSLVSGVDNTSARFAGGKMRPANPNSRLEAPFSVEAWIKPSSVNGHKTVFSTRWPSEYTFDFTIYNGKIHGDLGTGSGWLTNSADSNSTIVANSVYHVVYSVAATEWKLFINGQLDNSGSLAQRPVLWNAGDEPIVGNHLRYGGIECSCLIDEVAIYNSALSSNRVAAHFGASGSAYRSEVMTDSPIRYWRLGEQPAPGAKDETGNGDGAYTGTVTHGVSGAINGNTAVSINGGGNRAVIPGRANLNNISTGLTIEAWVKPDWGNTSAWGKIVSKPWAEGSWNWPGVQYGLGREDTSNRLRFEVGTADGTSGYHHLSSIGGLTGGVWHHVVATYDGSQMRIYINGVLDASRDFSTPLAQRSSNLVLGTRSDSSLGEHWGGGLDEVAVYPHALARSRIAAHYELGSGSAPTGSQPACKSSYAAQITSDAPRLQLCLGESSGDVAYDETANHLNGSYRNAPTLGSAGIPGSGSNKAVTFDGVNDHLEVPDANDPTQYTLETWVKLNSTGEQSIIARTPLGGPANGASHQLRVAGGKFQHYVYDGTQHYVTGTTSVQTGNWYHVVGVATNNGIMKLYVNGQEEGSPRTIGTLWAGGDRWYVASNSSQPDNYLSGTLDEIAIYPQTLSASKILFHYQLGSGSARPVCKSEYRTELQEDSPRLHLCLDEDSGTIAYDSSSNKLDGTYRNGPLLQQSGILGGSGSAVGLDGTNDFVEVLDENDPTAYTIQAWVKLNSTQDQAIVQRTVAGGPNAGHSHELRISSGKFQHYVYADGNQRFVTGVTAVQTGVWYHVAGVATNNGAMRLYVNGQQDGEKTTIGTMWAGGDRWYIGAADVMGSGYLNGTVDEVTIHSAALTGDVLAAHFEVGSDSALDKCPYSDYVNEIGLDQPRAHFCFGETAGALIANDETVNELDGFYRDGPAFGELGIGGYGDQSAASFDGSNDFLEVPDEKDPSAYTLETWVKLDATANQSIILRTTQGGPSTGASHQLRVAGGKFQHYTYDGNQRFVTGTTTVQTGVWYHIAGVATSNGSMKLYVNGQEEGTPTTIGSLWSDGDRWYVASNSAHPDNYLDATLDDLAIYETALSGTDIAGHYQTGLDNSSPTTSEASLGCVMATTDACNDLKALVVDLSEPVEGHFEAVDFSVANNQVTSVESVCSPTSYCDEVLLRLGTAVDPQQLPAVSYSFVNQIGRIRPHDAVQHEIAGGSLTAKNSVSDPVINVAATVYPDAEELSELDSAPDGEVVTLDDNALQAWADQSGGLDACPTDKFAWQGDKTCESSAREKRLAERIVSLVEKGSGIEDGMPYAPDVLTLQEVRAEDAKNIAGRLNSLISLDGVSCNTSTETVERCYRVAIANPHEKAKVGTPTDDRVVQADTAVVYNVRTFTFAGETATKKVRSRYTNKQACVPITVKEEIPGTMDNYEPANIDIDFDLIPDCTGQRKIKEHYLARFTEKLPSGSTRTPLEIAAASAHLLTKEHLKTQGNKYTVRPIDNLHQNLKETWTGEIFTELKALSPDADVYAIAGDFNIHRCSSKTRPELVPAAACGELAWWNTLTNDADKPLADSVFDVVTRVEGSDAQQAAMNEQYDNGDMSRKRPGTPKRIDFLFVRHSGPATLLAASKDFTCGLGATNLERDRRTCDFLANPERYSDHNLIWSHVRVSP